MTEVINGVHVSCEADGRVVNESKYPKCKYNKNGVCTANFIEIEVHITTNPTYFNCYSFKE